MSSEGRKDIDVGDNSIPQLRTGTSIPYGLAGGETEVPMLFLTLGCRASLGQS